MSADVKNGQVVFQVNQSLVGVTEVHGSTGSGHRVVVDELVGEGAHRAGAANSVDEIHLSGRRPPWPARC